MARRGAVSARTVRVERVLDQPPVTVRAEIEPVDGRRVRIVRYERRRSSSARFERVPSMEGVVVAFDRLGTGVPYWSLFPQAGLFDGVAADA